MNKTEAQLTLQEVIDAFDKRADPKKNEIVERYTFFTRDQKEGEKIEAYQNDLKLLAKSCNFADLENSLIRDRIVCGIRSTTMRERLLQKDNLTLESCVQMCKAAEMSREQVKTIEKPENATANVDKITRKKKFQGKRATKPAKKELNTPDSDNSQRSRQYKCKKCGRRHGPRSCPAYGKTCDACGKPNHFSPMCTNTPAQNKQKNEDVSQKWTTSM